MYFENGTIQAKIKTGGGFDSDNYPIKPAGEWSKPIPCHIKVNRKNNLGKQNGNSFTVASYEVFIEADLYELLMLSSESEELVTLENGEGIDLTPSTFEDCEFERVRLIQRDKSLGEFSVLWTECLENVGSVKIVV